MLFFSPEASVSAATLGVRQLVTLAAWLRSHPSLRVAVASDCACDANIAQMREVGPWGKPITDYEPYTMVGDFRATGSSDFAVVVLDAQRSDGRGKLVIFDGPFSGTEHRPAYVGDVGNVAHHALFQSLPGHYAIFGKFESEGCGYEPFGSTYRKDCNY